VSAPHPTVRTRTKHKKLQFTNFLSFLSKTPFRYRDLKAVCEFFTGIIGIPGLHLRDWCNASTCALVDGGSAWCAPGSFEMPVCRGRHEPHCFLFLEEKTPKARKSQAKKVPFIGARACFAREIQPSQTSTRVGQESCESSHPVSSAPRKRPLTATPSQPLPHIIGVFLPPPAPKLNPTPY